MFGMRAQERAGYLRQIQSLKEQLAIASRNLTAARHNREWHEEHLFEAQKELHLLKASLKDTPELELKFLRLLAKVGGK